MSSANTSFAQNNIIRKPSTSNSIVRHGTPNQSKKVNSTIQDSSVIISDPTGYNNGHGYVDLGLPSGTLWATCNVGADSPEDNGDYFAWGEIWGYNDGKKNFSWRTYKYCKGSHNTLVKYCTENYYGIVDNRIELDLEDDAATVNWGSGWKMPTDNQILELRNTEYCTWSQVTKNGRNGYKVTSKKNGASIFLPAAGYRQDSSHYKSCGSYWSCSKFDRGYSPLAYYLCFYSNGPGRNDGSRDIGRSIRPVCK